MSTKADPQVGPVEASIREKVRCSLNQLVSFAYAGTQLMDALSPTTIEITNDSWKHKHHRAMLEQGGGAETRESMLRMRLSSTQPLTCRLLCVHRIRGFSWQGKSDIWNSSHRSANLFAQILMQRHRMIYKILSDELSQQVHALSLVTKTPDELIET